MSINLKLSVQEKTYKEEWVTWNGARVLGILVPRFINDGCRVDHSEINHFNK